MAGLHKTKPFPNKKQVFRPALSWYVTIIWLVIDTSHAVNYINGRIPITTLSFE